MSKLNKLLEELRTDIHDISSFASNGVDENNDKMLLKFG